MDSTTHPAASAATAKADAANAAYWRSNLRLTTILLLIWAFVGLGCGVLFADALSSFSLGGFPLGFWFAQQGSIATFVVLILVYAVGMNRLDKKHHQDLENINADNAQGRP